MGKEKRYSRAPKHCKRRTSKASADAVLCNGFSYVVRDSMMMLAIAGKGRTKAPKEYGDESDSSEIDRRKKSRPQVGTKQCTSTATTFTHCLHQGIATALSSQQAPNSGSRVQCPTR